MFRYEKQSSIFLSLGRMQLSQRYLSGTFCLWILSKFEFISETKLNEWNRQEVRNTHSNKLEHDILPFSPWSYKSVALIQRLDIWIFRFVLVRWDSISVFLGPFFCFMYKSMRVQKCVHLGTFQHFLCVLSGSQYHQHGRYIDISHGFWYSQH